jgi:chaperonin GroES
MKCPIEPLGDRVVLLPVDEGEQQYGSIIVPDMGKEKPEMGEVLAVGEGRVTNDGAIIRNQLKEGQIVMVPKFGAQVVVVEGETYIIASENDVLREKKNKENE